MVWKNEQENGIFVFENEFKNDLNKRFTLLDNYTNDEHIENSAIVGQGIGGVV